MRKRVVLALLGAGAGLALLILIWYAAFHIGALSRADQRILRGFAGLRRPRTSVVANFIAHLCDPRSYVFLAALPLIVALVRRRVRSAFAIGAILLGANVTTQLLKPLLAAPRPVSLPGGVDTIALASWPSGHATAAMALALCCVIAAPQRLRPAAAALGAVFAVAVSYSFLTLGWHYPSDVLGGFLVAGIWTLLGAAAVLGSRDREAAAESSADARRPGVRGARQLSIGEALEPVAVALLGALALAAVITLARPHAVFAYARGHKTFLVGALVIAALGLVLATTIMALVAGLEVRLRPGGRRRASGGG